MNEMSPEEAEDMGWNDRFDMEDEDRVEGAARDMLDVLKYVAERIRNSDEWWMDCPDKGGFDLDLIESAIAKAEGK